MGHPYFHRFAAACGCPGPSDNPPRSLPPVLGKWWRGLSARVTTHTPRCYLRRLAGRLCVHAARVLPVGWGRRDLPADHDGHRPADRPPHHLNLRQVGCGFWALLRLVWPRTDEDRSLLTRLDHGIGQSKCGRSRARRIKHRSCLHSASTWTGTSWGLAWAPTIVVKLDREG
jgi:hypothetical protein